MSDLERDRDCWDSCHGRYRPRQLACDPRSARRRRDPPAHIASAGLIHRHPIRGLLTISVSFGRSILDNPITNGETICLDGAIRTTSKCLLDNTGTSARAIEIADRVEAFVRGTVVPYEKDARLGSHGPPDDLVRELRELARAAGVLTPHILSDGSHLTQRETAAVLIRTGLSPLGPVACNTTAPDEGNMYLLGKVGSPEMQERFLKPLVAGRARSAFFMTEPAEDGRRRLRSLDDADHLPAGRQPLGDQRAQDLHHRRRRRSRSGSSWPSPTTAPACSSSIFPIRRSGSSAS